MRQQCASTELPRLLPSRQPLWAPCPPGRYAKTKGQAEEAVKGQGFPYATIMRPGMLERGEMARGVVGLLRRARRRLVCGRRARRASIWEGRLGPGPRSLRRRMEQWWNRGSGRPLLCAGFKSAMALHHLHVLAAYLPSGCPWCAAGEVLRKADELCAGGAGAAGAVA